MKLPLDSVCSALVVLFAAVNLTAADNEPSGRTSPPAQAKPASAGLDQAPAPLFVGLRRSSYGLRKQNGDDAWWSRRAIKFAANFPGAQPLVLQIVSNYQDDGSTEIEFPRPASFHGSTTNMTFRHGAKLNHERALSTYDAQGVKALIQFEPGSADVAACFALAHQAFGHHPCVIGMAIDAEWFRTKESPDQTGLPITDSDAQRWMEQLLSLNPAYVLLLKHFEPRHLPPHYRHPSLWFLTDSQEFASQAEWIKDMRDWALAFKGAPLGAQYGYPKDQKWWAQATLPPVALGRSLRQESPDYRMLLWVDFTAARVEFGPN